MSEKQTRRPINESTARSMIQVSNRLRGFVDRCGKLASFLILPLIVITVFDVTARKLIWIQIWLVENLGRIFESTLLQELEWHFHTGLFAIVLGFGYIYNTHVRVDLVREHLNWRKKAWLEFIGCTAFMIPYTIVVIWFSFEYAYNSFMIGEISASQVGLSHRWIIKSVLVFGLFVAMIAGISVWLQTVLVLWGPAELRFPLMTLDWPEEGHKGVEGKARIEFDPNSPDELEKERLRLIREREGRTRAAAADAGAPGD